MIYKFIRKMLDAMLYNRADDMGILYYFSEKDFPGLVKEDYIFTSRDGHDLVGGFYYYEGYNPERLIIFDHGMGSGHTGYMKEIEMLCRKGYRVLSYDHTGCMKSGGTTTGGFLHSLIDLNDCINSLKADEKYNKLDLSVMGHSWGAFSTLNICALHPEVSHIVAMSGFVGLEEIFRQFLSVFYKKIYFEEAAKEPEFVRYNAIDSLKNSDVKALIIHSDDDKTVNCKKHFEVMRKALSHKENIEFLKVSGKNHNPNYTESAVKLSGEMFKNYSGKLKGKHFDTQEKKDAFKKSYDWNKITEQDEKIWEIIYNHLEK